MRATSSERRLVGEYLIDRQPGDDERASLERLLIVHREQLLKPFEDLRIDYQALADYRVAQHLEELLRTLRGLS